MINSLSNNKEYCYASNSYFANQLSVKEKTISNSINNLKRKKYIDVKFVNRQRKIYLNKTVVSNENYQYKRKEYTRKNNNINNKLIPYWMEHPEVCKSEKASSEEQAYMEELLSKYKED